MTNTIREEFNKAKGTATAPIRLFLKILFQFIAWVFVFAIVIFACVIVLSWYKLGVFGDIGTYLGVGVEKTNIGRIAKAEGVSWWDYILNAEFIGRTAVIGETESTQENIAFKIDGFTATTKTVEVGKAIIARADIVEVTAPLDRDLDIDLTNACHLEDSKGESYKGRIEVDKTGRFISKGKTDTFSVTCTFVDGLTEKGMAKIRLNPVFMYEQNVRWLAPAKSEFETTDERKTPVWSEKVGPEVFTVGSYDSPPYYNQEKNIFAVTLKPNLGWSGQIKDIKDLQVKVPSGAVLLTDEQSCNFQEQGTNTYVVRYDILEIYNVDCTVKQNLIALGKLLSPSGSALNYDECIKKLKKEFQFTCPFAFYGLTSTVLEDYPFMVSIKYDYEVSDITTVDVKEPLVA